MPAIELESIQLSLGGKVILEDINLKLETGEYLGLIGPNGAGKTMLLKIILGLVKPDRGTVRVFGQPPQAARGLIGYVPQYARFDSSFPISVLDVVLMGRLVSRPIFRRYNDEDYQVAESCLSIVEMKDHQHKLIGELSGGQLQRVLIARALTLNPNLLLLDEPTASLDTPSGRSLYQTLQELNQHITIVLVSHDIGVIAQHVKCIACLNQRLHFHHSKDLPAPILETVYGCPVELIAHGHAHRVLPTHEDSSDS